MTKTYNSCSKTTYSVKPADPDSRNIKNMTLMIVDDSPLLVTKTKELLEDVKGIADIKSCGTYTEAIEMLVDCKPHLALLDINLPDKSGIDLLKYIRAYFSATIVIMVTNQSGDFYRNRSMDLGAAHYIDKSKDFEKLNGLVCPYFL